jgi:hypothetical protein
MLGTPDRLHHGEVELAGAIRQLPNVVSRTWEYWSTRTAPLPSGRANSARSSPRGRRKVKKRR